MKQALETRILAWIQAGKGGAFTRPLSLCYSLAVRGRNLLYDRGLFAQKHAPLPVVSIGNLVVGGVGKTQVALLLAGALDKGAILTRGFRGEAEKQPEPLVVAPDRQSAAESGDEPWLLASRLPHTPVIVNRDRYKSALRAHELGAKVVLLDDGMQHRQLYRNFEIVVVRGSDPLGGGHFLPRGLLRDDPRRLARADLIVSVGALEQPLDAYTDAPIVETEVRVRGSSLGPLKGKRVGLFCGIGNPSRFVESVKSEGAEVVASHFVPDHKAIGEKEMERFTALCREQGAEALLCTEKDWVKRPKSALPIGWVDVELEVVRNREAWSRIVEEITLLAGIAR